MQPIRVLVVDDSAFMRKYITDILQQDPGIQVARTARNGKEALAFISAIQPDVITLDIEMPVMDGISTLKQLVQTSKIPVIMLSSLTQDGADKTIESLEIGAFDFVGKPSGTISLDLDKVGEHLRARVKAAVSSKRIKVQTGYIDAAQAAPLQQQKKEAKTTAQKNPDIIAIGASTGGPRALQVVLTHLPADVPPVVIVQHMPPGFTKSLATRLNQLCKVRVSEVVDGELLRSGHAYIAPGGYQFRVEHRAGQMFAKVNADAPVNGHRPSVDVLFESLAGIPSICVYAAILTGMGSDGAIGIANIKRRGGFTIAEAEESCIVFGMPRAAIAKGGIDVVVPLSRVAAELINYREPL
ncbi:chemotaxis response regulator protein-glutamate methylesterase [Fodinisporobacter ferrooxydans]|uniref:Protein-glutamate methylesterase/protein-glutamine glutaminase n=1 Tax=Fodinisporobacter ferrooxydans TaxID=2901836 RepID=A0ABY4CFV9_9BACL|nr:chemotaxis response regulator protein-glutamate methylesterase [Alicyclobacillaceae bacterium MYW30-H2]